MIRLTALLLFPMVCVIVLVVRGDSYFDLSFASSLFYGFSAITFTDGLFFGLMAVAFSIGEAKFSGEETPQAIVE